MKAQACRFQRKKFDKEEKGIAILKNFDAGDVDIIIDINGKPVKGNVWSYNLDSGPMAYLDTNYPNID